MIQQSQADELPQEEYEASMVAKRLEASRVVTLGNVYRHYKSENKLYVVRDLIIIEATGEIGVVYQAQYGEKLTFVRPLGDWLSEAEVDGRSVLRFEEVKNQI
jgi:hypothetical protein